ncbi:putative membrane protein YCR023C-like protein 7 [Colletotrichum chlorophyti]|uniref:Putative membrane protein YCR023C-like protein 7 n=1 Tax=Colletotrichum chlorophyti TaxID=708187 RepID=A0A1Q8S027_9PEZI|nr:putative membrane protein YCR023C-like protein 7 [Colletotrichum chlorophyti]
MENKNEQVSWLSLPRKDQLFILFFVRFSEPVVKASIAVNLLERSLSTIRENHSHEKQTYLYYQLKSLDPSLSSPQIIRQSATLQTAFIVSQCISSLFLGKLSDSPKGGRKLVLLIGLGGSFVDVVQFHSVISCVLFGFIRHFYQALILYTLEGAFNGNVATVRTMVSEVVQEKRFQARAFVLLPMAFNVAVLVSPLMAGQLADLRGRYPDRYGDSQFLRKFPYAPPALVNGMILAGASLVVFLFLEETSKVVERRHDSGIAIGQRLKKVLCLHHFRKTRYERLSNGSTSDVVEGMPLMLEGDRDPETPPQAVKTAGEPQVRRKHTNILPLRRILTANLCLVLMAAAVQDGHIAVYSTLWPNFLSDPVIDDAHIKTPSQRRRIPFRFSGGAGMAPDDIAWSLALLDVLGLPMKLLAYPRITQRVGTLRTWRFFLRFFPLVYTVVPYIAVMPSMTPPPAGKHGFAVWALIMFSQALMVGCSTFTAPSQLVLINLASPHPSALARTNSISYLLTAIVRATASVVSAWVYSYGSAHGLTGLAWWLAGVVSVGGCLINLICQEGNGLEIWLSGDKKHRTPRRRLL